MGNIDDMKQSFLVVAGALMVASCVKSPTSNNATPVSIGGGWTFVATVTFGAATCKATAAVAVSQAGTDFTGNPSSSSDSCTPTSASTTYAFNASIGGNVNGAAISFSSANGCTFIGAANAQQATQMSGTFSCNPAFTIDTSKVSGGSWQATR